MSKRYPSIRDVNIADVIRSFPLGSINPKDKDTVRYSNLLFRFETCIFNQMTQRKIVVFKDIMTNDLEALEQVPAPVYKDKIKLKVLMMPKQAGKK